MPKKQFLAPSLFFANKSASLRIVEEPCVLLQPNDAGDEAVDALTHDQVRPRLFDLGRILWQREE